MAVVEFPAASLTVEGGPNAIRASYIGTEANRNRGGAFEQPFRRAHHLDETDGWEVHHYDRAEKRYFDVVNNREHVMYELKSGGEYDARQVAKDVRFLKTHPDEKWNIVYVFGEQPSPQTVEYLESRGIVVQVWETAGVPVH